MVSPGEDALPWKHPVPSQVNKPQGHTLMLNLVKHQFRFTLNRTYINLRLKSVKFINQVKCKILKTTKNNNNNNNKEQKKRKEKDAVFTNWKGELSHKDFLKSGLTFNSFKGLNFFSFIRTFFLPPWKHYLLNNNLCFSSIRI